MAETHLEVPPFSDVALLALRLRREVFVDEQRVPAHEEYDTHDLTARCFVAIEAGRVVATLRVIDHGPEQQISRMAVRRDTRGQGVGRRLLAHVLDRLADEGHTRLWLNAQLDKAGFYERHGFAPIGDPFDEAGIAHVRMQRGR